MLNYLHHLLLPRESNNHKARMLHAIPQLILIAVLLALNILMPFVERIYPQVLGISVNISANELVDLTNRQRAQAGLSPLKLDPQLSQAAAGKASDMLTKNYWAHNSPDGITPWVFIKNAGYDYLYAGENLARGFTNAQEAVNAWMASPGHRENILSGNYQDVGFAIVTGSLTGDETVLIVEEFGRRSYTPPSVEVAANQTVNVTPVQISPTTSLLQPTRIAQAVTYVTATPVPTKIPVQTYAYNVNLPNPVQSVYIASVNKNPLINKDFLTKNMALVIASFFIILFILDLVIIERKKIIRMVSHSTDHLMFLTVVLLAVLLYGKGLIL